MINKIRILGCCMLVLGLSACKEQNYRGVPESKWQHLSAEQRQLIIDKTYQDEMCKDQIS